MFDNLKTYSLILASASPRRSELLKGLGLPFRVRLPEHADEDFPAEMPVSQVAEYIAAKKADACLKNSEKNELFITADTIVALENEILGKPVDEADAYRMLKMLSGNKHTVYTGVCLTTHQRQIRFTDETQVWFKTLSEEEITYYITTFRPFDKAGSYGIQEWIGYAAVSSIEGSYYNVMGLPVHRLYQALSRFQENSSFNESCIL